MNNRVQHQHYRSFVNGVRNMRDTLYWINEAAARHQNEIQSHPGLKSVLADALGADMLKQWEDLRMAANHLKDSLQSLQYDHGLRRRYMFNDTMFEDLSREELDQLENMNAALDRVGTEIAAITSKIDAEIAVPLDDPEDPMTDRNLAVELGFYLKDDDPGADGSTGSELDADDTLSTFELAPRELTDQWPEGYANEFPMPHGGILHSLRLYGSCGHRTVDYRDILRAGTVWIDIKVEYQYCYDLTAEKWVKRWRDDVSGNRTRVYVNQNK